MVSSILDITKNGLEKWNRTNFTLSISISFCNLFLFIYHIFLSLQLFDSQGTPTIKWLEQGSSSLIENQYFGHAGANSKECSCGDANMCGGDDGKSVMQKR